MSPSCILTRESSEIEHSQRLDSSWLHTVKSVKAAMNNRR